MPTLSPPTSRSDRSDGARHVRRAGRGGRRSSPPAGSDLQRLVVLPGALVVLLGAGTVAWLLAADPSKSLRTGVLAAVLVVAALILVAGAAAARSADRRIGQAVWDVTGAASQGDDQLRRIVEELRAGRTPMAPAPLPVPRGDVGRLGPLMAQLEHSQATAYTAITEAASLPTAPSGAAALQLAVLANLARRLQSLVHLGIKNLDELEQQVEDPDLLRGLFELDHLVTRIRRYVENVAVLGGEVTRRQWRKPVPLASVIRSAIAEVEKYSRVKPVPPIDGEIEGAAVADVIHLLAELIENATAFSPPGTNVVLRTQRVTAGLVIEVEDRGLGQGPEEEALRNAVLDRPESVELAALLKDGRVGLYVVAVLARQHKIRVELRRNIFGGVTSLVLLPVTVLSDPSKAAAPAADLSAAPAAEVRQPVRAAQHNPPGDPGGLPRRTPAAVAQGQSVGRDAARPAPTQHDQTPAYPTASEPMSRPAERPAPAQHAPVQHAPAHQGPAHQGSAQQPPAQHTPAQQPPVRQAPVPQQAAHQPPAHQAPPPPASAHQAPPQPRAARPMPLPAQTQHTQGTAPVPPMGPGPSSSPVQGMTPSGPRPPLPQRTQQARLAPQLQLPVQPQSAAHADHADYGGQEYSPALANPALMAAYRRGVRAAEEQTDRSDG